MKLCVTSTGKDLDSKVEEHFARAAYFVIIDTGTMAFEAVQNSARTPERWSGVGAAELVLDKGPEAVLTGFIGPQAFNALNVGYMQVYVGASGKETVRESVGRFRNDEYREASEPSGGQRQS